MSEVITSSALVDMIKKVWKLYKNNEFPIAGDYYYHEIDRGVWFGKIINIPLAHFDNDIKQRLEILERCEIQEIIYRCIVEVLKEKYGKNLTTRIHYNNRIRWRFV